MRLQAEESTVSVLSPPAVETRDRPAPPLQRSPPGDPPDFLGGWDGDGPGDGSGGDGRGRGDSDPQDAARFGLLLAMVGITVLFAVFVAVYVLVRDDVDPRTEAPPLHLWAATAILFASSLALVRACREQRFDRGRAAHRWLRITLVLGVLFLFVQALLWRRLAVAGWIPQRGPTVTLFWALTGLHAVHVIVGLATLIRVLRRRELTSRQALPQRLLPLGATYWHFLGVLWAILFLVLFYGR